MKVMTVVMFVLIVVSTAIRVKRNYKVNKFGKEQRKKREKEKMLDS